jgi:hypothetical protein
MRTTYLRSLFVVAVGLSMGAVPAVAAPVRQHATHKADALQTRLIARTSAVDTKLTRARKAGRVSTTEAAQMQKKLAWVRADSAKYVKQQGFLSAGESASYSRTLDEIEAKLG